jgi:large subunit ribosomal protein L14e
MIEVGRVCVKTAGRDSNQKCVIIELIDKNYVLIDGQTRRKKCNIVHLEPLDKKINIKKGASHEEILKEFEKLGFEVEKKADKKKEKKPQQKAAKEPKEKKTKEKK